ncbi:MAG: DUF5666 domain-containing protein [Vicinamibacterales bacterium]
MAYLLAAALSLVSASAHPGHGSTLLVGTLLSVSANEVTIEVRDLASLTTKRVRVAVDADTKYRRDKERVTWSELVVGSRVEIAAAYEEDADGRTAYLATEIKLPKAKPKR